MRRTMIASLKMVAVTLLVCGLLYSLALTVVAQLAFPDAANGSLVEAGGKSVGSALIGQEFTSERYFHGRPSAAGSGYDALASGASNLAPSSRRLSEAVAARAADVLRDEPGLAKTGVPVDLVTSSGSGLDPHISPSAALAQVRRVARARGMTSADVKRIVEANTEPRQFGLLGEARVNVLRVNLALDAAR